MQPAPIICETPRLTIRPTTMDDADFVCGLYTDPEVCRFLGGVKPPEVTRLKVAELADHQQQFGFSRWSVILKARIEPVRPFASPELYLTPPAPASVVQANSLRSTGELIGRCGPMVKQIGGVPEVELGYSFARAYWGQGYATEAARAVLSHCFRVLGQRRVVAIIEPENEASIRVAEKIGMIYQGLTDWEGLTFNLYAAHSNGG